jgi:hypothetical protein
MQPIARFSLVELSDIEQVAIAMVKAKQGRDNPHQIDITRPQVKLVKLGKMGEHAVAEILGLQVNNQVLADGDGGIMDLYDPKRHKSIQIKTSFCPYGHLATPNKHNFRADWIVFCVLGEPNAIKVCGYIDQATWLVKARQKDFGKGLHWAVPQSELAPIWELL